MTSTYHLAALKRSGARTAARGRWTVVVGAAAVLLAVLAGPVAAAGAKAPPDLGRFAGYEALHRDVRSVRGSWVVPRVARHQTPGDQSLIWIGTRGIGSSQRAPFIQVGVRDVVDSLGEAEAFAFWSDTAEDFEPLPLHVSLKAGDRLRASLTLAGGRWHVVLDDLTTRRVAHVSTSQQSHATFNLASWLEEDQTYPIASGPVEMPFAHTSTVRFSALDCNGSPPTHDSLYSLWMSLPHATLGPTPLGGDSFAVVTKHLSQAAGRYVALVTAEDRAESGFVTALSSWRRGGPSSTIDPLAARLTGQLHAVTLGLTSPGWPTSSASARASLVAADRRLIAHLAQVPALPPSARRAWARGWARLSARVTRRDQALRNILGAPGITPY